MSAGGSVLPTHSKEAEFGQPLNTKSPPSKAMGRGVGTGKIFNLAECPGGFVISCPGARNLCPRAGCALLGWVRLGDGGSRGARAPQGLRHPLGAPRASDREGHRGTELLGIDAEPGKHWWRKHPKLWGLFEPGEEGEPTVSGEGREGNEGRAWLPGLEVPVWVGRALRGGAT